MKIDLPWPPTVNNYTAVVGKRKIKSAKGRQYLKDAVNDMFEQKVPTVPKGDKSRFDVHINAWPPDRRRRDLDNLFKASLDALVEYGVIPDDGAIDALSIVRQEVMKGGRFEVTVEKVEWLEK